jgi:hypothetical protein
MDESILHGHSLLDYLDLEEGMVRETVEVKFYRY